MPLFQVGGEQLGAIAQSDFEIAKPFIEIAYRHLGG